MDDDQLFQGLFMRLHGSGLHAVLSGELASANYPTDQRGPLFAPRVPVGAVNRHTEQYLDRGSMTLDEVWLAIWGVAPAQYFDVDPGSPAAREYGLGTEPPAGPAQNADLERFQDAFWFLPFDGSLRRWAGLALPQGTDPLTRYLADLMCGLSPSFEQLRKGKSTAGFTRKMNPEWRLEMEALSVAWSICMLTDETSCDLLVRGVAGEFYRRKLGLVVPRSETLVSVLRDEPGHDRVAVTARITRLISESSTRHGVRLLAGENLWNLSVAVIASWAGAKAGLDRGLSVANGISLADAFDPVLSGA